MDAILERGRTPEEKASLLHAWREERRDHDVPPVEDFPCHPDDETEDMRDLAALLTFRFIRAGRVWSGERVTLRQVIEEAVAGSQTRA
jgi:hypothetical protein